MEIENEQSLNSFKRLVQLSSEPITSPDRLFTSRVNKDGLAVWEDNDYAADLFSVEYPIPQLATAIKANSDSGGGNKYDRKK